MSIPTLARRYLPAAALLALSIVVWQLVATYGGIDNFILPSPTEVASALVDDRALLAADTWVTLKEILLGFGLALLVGLTLALLLHLSQMLRNATYPLLIASQTIPVIVLAPILVIMFGYDIRPKLAIVALICFFPIVVNTLAGLGSADRATVQMMRSLDASRWGLLRRVELPGSLPALFTGLKIAATVAAIGAVFGEWVGSDSGLGHLMLQGTAQLETARVFAAVVVLSAISIALFLAVGLVERAAVPWARQQ